MNLSRLFKGKTSDEIVTDKPNVTNKLWKNEAELLLAPLRQALEAPGVITFGQKPEYPSIIGGVLGLLAGFFGFYWEAPVIAELRSIWDMTPGIAFASFLVVLGYCGLFYVTARLDIDLWRRRWVFRPAGIRPFTRRTEGSLDEWEQVRFARENDVYIGELPEDFWRVTLIAPTGNRVPPLPGFDYLPCESVSREEALALAQQLALKLDLPLREKAKLKFPLREKAKA